MIFHLNGKRVPEAQAVVPVTDRGFLYGDGLFETLHGYGPQILRLPEHLERMRHGIRTLDLKNVPSTKMLTRWLLEALHAGAFPETNLRLTVTRGSGPCGPGSVGSFKPTIVIMASPYTRRPEAHYTQGVAAIIASFRRQESSVAAGLKTTNYLEQILARKEADAAGVDEALFLNSAGLLCEGSASNITLVREGVICAPDPKLVGALPGTGQRIVLELARKLKLPVRLGPLGPWDLKDCDEAFLTGSLREITPLVRVNGQPVANGKPGPLTTRLIQAYRTLVKKECPGWKPPVATC